MTNLIIKNSIFWIKLCFTLDTRKNEDSKIKNLKDTVNEKRGNVYRAHNDYLFKIREYNFIDKDRVEKIRSLVNYYDESQKFINKSWLVSIIQLKKRKILNLYNLFK